MKLTAYIFIYSLLAVVMLSAAPADSLERPNPDEASPGTSDTMELPGIIAQTGNCMQYNMPILGKGTTLSKNIKRMPLQEDLEYDMPVAEPSPPPCEKQPLGSPYHLKLPGGTHR